MGKSIFDDIAQKASSIPAVDEAVRWLTETSAVFEVQRKAAQIIELSGASAAQRRLDEESQKIAPSLSQIVEKELSFRNLIEEKVLGIAYPKYLDAFQELKSLEGATTEARGITSSALNYVKTLEERFRLPYLDEATRVYHLVKDSFGSRLADSFILRQQEFADLVSTLKSPWIDCISSVESFESIARLASVGKALLPTAYDAAASDTLRSLLGDWSHVTLSEPIFSDWRVRQQLYLDYGFDKLLTVLPEPAFTDSLFETKILRYDLFPSGQPVVEPEESDGESFEEYRWKRRVLDAHGILLSLEDGLRIFIHKTMTERFGPGWEKRHISGEVYKTWVEKRETARNNGGKENRLLWYADFTDYIEIIERGDNWKEVFEPIFRNKMDVQVSFQRLGPIRVSAAHYRVVTKEDYLLLSVESQRILKAIGMIDNLN